MTARRTRFYLDTSLIIMVEPDQDPVRRAITDEFFRIVADNPDEYELLLSRVTIDELNEAESAEQRKASADFLTTIKHTRLPINDEAEGLALIYDIEKVLTTTHIDDLTHVAYAVVSKCDCIITWNMRHLANDRTIERVNAVNEICGYGKIDIKTPKLITGE